MGGGKRFLLAVLITLAGAFGSFAGENREEKKISIDFHIDSWEIDSTLNDNSQSLRDLHRLLDKVRSNPHMSVDHLTVSGNASPDGQLDKNKELSLRRAVALREYLINSCDVPDSLMRFGENRVPWDMFREIISATDCPWTADALRIMAIGSDDNAADNARRINLLKKLHGGDAWSIMCQDILPRLRSAFVITTVITILPEEVIEVKEIDEFKDIKEVMDSIPSTSTLPTPATPSTLSSTTSPSTLPSHNSFTMALYTNMLFDAAAVPNIGVEFYLGKNWSVAANYMHAWWSKDRRHRYWRIYGGDVNVRWWFGRKAHEKPLTGHHIGAYVQALTYDFEWGGKGYMAGEPGGNIFDRAHIGGGIEYGYSLPVARRLDIDFTLGVGYIGGRVYEFRPAGNLYFWTATKNRSWFGPTKLEVSLVWLIGKGNTNARHNKKEKGGEP